MPTREAHVGDASAIARIHVTAWQVAYRGIMPDAVIDALSIPDRTRLWAGRLELPIRPPRHFVSERDGVVIGWATVGIGRDPDLPPDTQELYALYLDPAHWRQGAGTELYHCAETAARESGRVLSLWVLDANQRARGFYERVGFTVDGVRKTDEHGIDGVRYIKRL